MKRLVSILLVISILASFAVPASAEYLSQNEIVQLLSAMGIMQGDENGDLHLSDNLTRAQFVKLLLCASPYKDTLSPVSNTSPFSDVSYQYWAASYIRTAVAKGYFSGYSDGTFRPDNNISLEEAVAATLRMVGYTSSDYTGGYPYAQLSIYKNLGLDTNVAALQGEALTRKDAMYLFYNLLNSNPKNSNSKYITNLGYKLDSNGEIDFTSIVMQTTIGPVTVKNSNWYSGTGINSSYTFYRDGLTSSLSGIQNYDIVYYSTSGKTVWAYSDKVTGIFESASPNKDTPTSITVSGKTYQIETLAAKSTLASGGRFVYGDTVTLLLGRNGAIADAISPLDSGSSVKYGVVTSQGTKTFTDTDGKTFTSTYVHAYLTTGEEGDYAADSDYDTGTLITLTYSGNAVKVTPISKASGLTGLVSYNSGAIGDYKVSKDIKIVDTYDNKCKKIFLQRIDGVRFDKDDVLYSHLDSSGEIDELILNNVTDDFYDYGILTAKDENITPTNISCSYTVDVGGSVSTFSVNKMFGVESGPVYIYKNNNTLEDMHGLKRIYDKITSVNSVNLNTANAQYKMAENVLVYIAAGSGYTMSTLSEIQTQGGYELYPFMDKSNNEGGRVRLIIAKK